MYMPRELGLNHHLIIRDFFRSEDVVLKKTKEGEGEMHNDCCSHTSVFSGQEKW